MNAQERSLLAGAWYELDRLDLEDALLHRQLRADNAERLRGLGLDEEKVEAYARAQPRLPHPGERRWDEQRERQWHARKQMQARLRQRTEPAQPQQPRSASGQPLLARHGVGRILTTR